MHCTQLTRPLPFDRKNVDDFTGPRERSDLGFITFDLSADIKPIFDWNVKQLFLYLSAEYATKSNVRVLQWVYTLCLETVYHFRKKRGGTYLNLSNGTLVFVAKCFPFRLNVFCCEMFCRIAVMNTTQTCSLSC